MTTPRNRVEVQPRIKSLLDDLELEEPLLEALPVLQALPVLEALPALEPLLTALPTTEPLLSPILAALPGRAVPGAADFDLGDRIRRTVINNVIVFRPPPLPKDPPRTLWWMPGFRYRNPLRDKYKRQDAMLQKSDKVDFDGCLEALVKRQKDALTQQWRPELVPSIWADEVADERKALIGYPEGYAGKVNPVEYPPELFTLIHEIFLDLREALWNNPEQMLAMPNGRYNLLNHVGDWWGHPLTWEEILAERDNLITSPLACAIDYVCWRTPMLANEKKGGELARLMIRANPLDEEQYPMDNFFFPHHHDGVVVERSQQGNRIAMRGGFAPAETDAGLPLIVYVSAAGMFGDKMPTMVPGWRQITMVPLPVQYPPRHVCRVDCQDWECLKDGDPLFDDPDDCYGGAC